ncbi:Crp/Fnr family transcriptional regulator [Pullulanibacillus sp. KACC 23026]|uniref:Crp/Fnr family transcriptional regulator n=1 Tax=Pullulanibacillus sp. KACC 23026 TaxID=3028315 RepID=UPI0023B1A52D|nr:Crp/Fnr family transcriptional regulator [Pullulanibacillus sp. KACC 23026]WEG12065.1 Crp/Fnr family transcriptional regulator [Pullulanibacillus sp. KACC 23026]
MSDQTALLKSIPIFSELTTYELAQVETISILRDYEKKSYIFMEGEKREAVYFIQKGTIKTFKLDSNGKEQLISLLYPGDMFPHVGFFDDSPYPATAEAVVKAQLVMIQIEEFNALLIERPGIALKVMKILGQKIQALTQRIQELISDDVYHRTVNTLIRLASESDRSEDGMLILNAPITNQDFANMVGSSRETINRIFNQFKKEGLLEINKRKIKIIDLEGLKQTLK